MKEWLAVKGLGVAIVVQFVLCVAVAILFLGLFYGFWVGAISGVIIGCALSNHYGG